MDGEAQIINKRKESIDCVCARTWGSAYFNNSEFGVQVIGILILENE